MVSSVVSAARVESATRLMGTNCTVVFAKQVVKTDYPTQVLLDIIELGIKICDYLTARERRKQAEAILEREIEALEVLTAKKETALKIREELMILMEEKREFLYKKLRLKLEEIAKAYEHLLNDVRRKNRALKIFLRLLEDIRIQLAEILRTDGRNGYYARLEEIYYRVVSEFPEILVSINSREKFQEEVNRG